MSEHESQMPDTEEKDAELHGKRHVMASDEPRDETESDDDDDVELHGGRRKAL